MTVAYTITRGMTEVLDVTPLDVPHSGDTGPLEEIREVTCGFAVRLDRLRRQVAGTQGTPPRGRQGV